MAAPWYETGSKAWKYGPVIPDLYQAVKKWGSGPVRETLPGYHAATGVFEDSDRELMSIVLSSYGHLGGLDLSNLTHKKDTPWFKVYFERGGRERRHAAIPGQLIKEHFDGLLREAVP